MKHLVIWNGIILHIVWALTLMTSTTPLGVTAISTIANFGLISAPSAATFYLLVAICAMAGINAPKRSGLWLLIPQSIVFCLAAWGAGHAIVAGQFADGVVRSRQFLIADQSRAIIVAVLHVLAVIDNYRSKLV